MAWATGWPGGRWGRRRSSYGASITVHLDDLIRARGLTLTELADRVGLTLANLSILKTGKAKAIRFTTLAALCAELGCQPGDLLSFNASPGP